MKKNIYDKYLFKTFEEHSRVLKKTQIAIKNGIKLSSEIIVKSLKKGGTIFWCGNGGSAADSQHIAAEFVGRFKKNRKPLRSIALTTDTSILTCVSNDYSFEEVFSRQIDALGRKGDVLVAISTSGNSRNVKRAIIQAQKMGLKTIGLLGKSGGTCKNYVDVPLIIPSNNTARIQEIHILIEHLLCEIIEHKLGLD
jgi:D-sedoheptulose 7-phosphate isomerase